MEADEFEADFRLGAEVFECKGPVITQSFLTLPKEVVSGKSGLSIFPSLSKT